MDIPPRVVDLQGLNLNLLAPLGALLAHRNVSRAAHQAGISQSAMSHTLHKLRVLLDDPLLVPSGRAMVLTSRGEALAKQLPPMLEQLADLLRPPEPFDPTSDPRTFRIATLDYFELTTLPQMLTYLRDHAPGVRLHVERLDASSADRLASGALDLVITGGSPRSKTAGIRRRLLYKEPFRVIARKDHPGIGNRLTLKRYLAAEHALVSVEGTGPGVVDKALAAQGLSRTVALRIPHFVSAPIIVSASDLICTVAASVAEASEARFGVRVYEPPLALPDAAVVAYWPARYDEDPGHRWLRRVLAEGEALSPALQKRIAKR